MSKIVTTVFAVIYILIAIGPLIWAIVVAYRGLTWLLTNFDDVPHIWKRNWRYYRHFIFRLGPACTVRTGAINRMPSAEATSPPPHF